MATKTNNVKNWFKSVKENIENKISKLSEDASEFGDRISNAPDEYVKRVTNPETEADKKLAKIDDKIGNILTNISNKQNEIRTKIISNDKLRTVAVAVCEKLIDKANPKKDAAFTLSMSIIAKLGDSLELDNPDFGETISDDKLRVLYEKAKQHPDFEQDAQKQLDRLDKENANELDMNEELIRSHYEEEEEQERSM